MVKHIQITKHPDKTDVAESAFYQYNDSNQLVSAKLFDGKKNTTVAYTYDENGNLISEIGEYGTEQVETYYDYTVENRLQAVYEADELLMAAAYDGDGNRVFQLNYNLHTDEDWKDNSGNGNGNNKDNTGSGNNGNGNSGNNGNGNGNSGNNGNDKENSKSEGTDDAGYGNATNAEEHNSQNQSGILFPIAEEISRTETDLITMIKTTGKEKDYELIEYILNVNTQYTQVLMELNENGAMDAAYTYGVSRLTEDRFTGESSFYLYDPAGNVAGITDQDGYLWQSYRYDAFGNATFGSPQYDNEYTFNGESYNPNIHSQYLRARYYDTVKGSFLTEDSYLGDIRNPLTLNRYSYCIGNPLFYVDPSGHWITWEERDELLKALPDKLSDDASTYFGMTMQQAFYWASSYLGALHELNREDATSHEVLGHAQLVEDIRALVKEAVKRSSAKNHCDVRMVLCLTESERIRQFITECEGGFKNKMYDADPGKGDWTIGIGHKVSKEEYKKYNGITISYKEGLKLFDEDMKKAVTGLADFLLKHRIQLKQNEFDAMVSFTFRYGENIWSDSRKPEDKGGSMLYFFKDGDYLKPKNPDAEYTEVEQIFAVYSGKGNAPGNRIRSCEEKALYLYGIYQRSNMAEKDLNDGEIIRMIEEYNKFHEGKEVKIVR